VCASVRECPLSMPVRFGTRGHNGLVEAEGDCLVTPDDSGFEGVELTSAELYALRVGEGSWMRGGRWRWAEWTQGVASSHHPSRDPAYPWDHDHCHFCHDVSFSREYDGDLREGWTAEHLPELSADAQTNAGYYWVCPTCFDGLRDQFAWIVVV
jgi:hypothetical protein